jgi:hypothetical protein
VVYSNSTIFQYDGHFPINATVNPWVLDEDTEQPLYNLLQAIHACIRVELGNPSPNNFILNPSFLNNSITSKFPATQWNPDGDQDYSILYHTWADPNPILQTYLPVNTSGPANIQVVYPCRLQQLKSTGSLFVSVLVATLSMFSTGWALFMLIATVLAKRVDPVGGTSTFSFDRCYIKILLSASANRCDCCYERHRSSVEPGYFDSVELRAADGGVPKISRGYTYSPLELSS